MRSPLLLAIVAAAMFFANLGGAHLWDEDEAIFSETAREMLVRGDPVVPYFNGELFAHKPPLMYWLMEGAFELFGTDAFAARFPSAVFGVGCVLLTWWLGRMLFSPAVGFWAGLILASNLNFNVIARAATPDSLLVFFSTLAVAIFVHGTTTRRGAFAIDEPAGTWIGQSAFEPTWPTWLLAYAAMALGVLTKGPIGVVLPTAVIGLFLLIARANECAKTFDGSWRGRMRAAVDALSRVFAPRHVLATIWSMRPLTALLAVLVVAAPWYWLVGMRTEGEFLVGFFGVHNFGRFLNPMENHRGPIVYYLAAIAIGFFPWSVLFGPGLIDMTGGELRRASAWQSGYVLLGSWIAVWVGFFSLAGTKLPSYVVPVYPALALFGGCLVARWLREPAVITRQWTRLVWATVALAGVGLVIALPIVGRIYLGDAWLLGAVGLVPLAGAALGWWWTDRQVARVRAAVITLAGLSFALCLAMFAVAAGFVDDYRDTPRFAAVVQSHSIPGQPSAVGAFHYFRPSFVFYTGQTVRQLEAADEVSEFFAAHAGPAFVLTTEEHFNEIASRLPADVRVLDTRRRFLRADQAVLLGRAANAPTTATKSPSSKKVSDTFY